MSQLAQGFCLKLAYALAGEVKKGCISSYGAWQVKYILGLLLTIVTVSNDDTGKQNREIHAGEGVKRKPLNSKLLSELSL